MGRLVAAYSSTSNSLEVFNVCIVVQFVFLGGGGGEEERILICAGYVPDPIIRG